MHKSVFYLLAKLPLNVSLMALKENSKNIFLNLQVQKKIITQIVIIIQIPQIDKTVQIPQINKTVQIPQIGKIDRIAQIDKLTRFAKFSKLTKLTIFF